MNMARSIIYLLLTAWGLCLGLLISMGAAVGEETKHQGQLPAEEEELKVWAKYVTIEMVEKGLHLSANLPELADVLLELHIGHMVNDFYARQVMDTLTFSRMSSMDLQLVGLDRGQIKACLEYIGRLKQPEMEAVQREHPLLEERSNLRYGRLFMDRGVGSYEFYEADFSAGLPLGARELVWLEPRAGCEVEEDTPATLQGKYVVVERGVCSFIDKAYSVARTGASAMIVINSDENLFHMAASLGGSSESDLGPPGMASVMVRRSTGLQLHKAVQMGPFRASMVPMSCGARGGSANCEPVIPEEVDWAQQARSGEIWLHPKAVAAASAADDVSFFTDSPIDFVSSSFGSVIPDNHTLLLVAHPRDGCSPLHNESTYLGAAVLVFRGGECNFGEKAAHLEAAGASFMIVAEDGVAPLQPIGAVGERGRDITIPGLFVTRTAGLALEQHSRLGGGQVSVNVENRIAEEWDELAAAVVSSASAAANSPNEDALVVLMDLMQAQRRGSRDQLTWLDERLRVQGISEGLLQADEL